jgi:DNA modification methylase
MLSNVEKLDKIHPYPAKFTIGLALEYLEKYSKPGDTVFDPFVGSGTTLLAASLLNRNGIGTDINHIAILVTKFKLLDLNDSDVEIIKEFINFLNDLNLRSSKFLTTKPFFYPSIDHWFKKDIILSLSFIKDEIVKRSSNNERLRVFFELIFSSIINSVSNQESDTRYAAIEKPKINFTYVIETFLKKIQNAILVILEMREIKTKNQNCKVFLQDSKTNSQILKKDSISLLFTSPPYPNTYDYYLYHKHRMNWLGYDVKYSMQKEIGSRREFSSLKKPKEKFNQDMYEILLESNKSLKVNGYAILVMGDGQIQGEKYEAKSEMVDICSRIGWNLFDYSFSLLDQTSKSFQKSYRTLGKKEHILVFKKGNKL